MPYYVYRIGTLGIPEKLGSASGYREAKAMLRSAREAPDAGAGLVRMIFAQHELEAEDLLTHPRAADPTAEGEDG